MITRVNTNLKESNVGWLGEIPMHWQIVPAKALFSSRREKARAGDIHLTPSQKYGVLPQAEYMEITGNRVVLNLSDSGQMKHVEAGDFVSHLRSFQGGLELANVPGKVSGAYTVLVPRRDQNPNFWRYVFKSFTYIQALQTTTDQLRDGQSIRLKEFSQIELPQVPLDEQKAIVDFLDRELAQIDALIAKQEELIGHVVTKIDRLILDSVTLGIEDESLVRCEDVWLQRCPKSWTYGRLKNCLRAPVTDGPHTTPEFVESGVPFLSVDGIQNGELVFEGCRYISKQDDYEFRKKANPEFGDILVGKAASVGKIAQVKVDFPFAIWSPLALLKIDYHSFDSTYVEYFLKSTYVQAQINAISNSNTQKNLGMNQIPKLRFLYPDKNRQIKIAEYLKRSTGVMNRQIEVANKVINALIERRQSLISAAVTGKIDFREAP